MADDTKVSTEVKETTEVTEVKETTPMPEVEELETVSKDALPVVEKAEEGKKIVGESVSFKEESNVVAELDNPRKKALEELKVLIEQAIKNNEFAIPPSPIKPVDVVKPPPAAAEAAGGVVVEKEAVSEGKPVKADEISAPSPSVVEETEVKVVEEATVAAPPVVEPPPAEEDGVKTVEAIAETVVPAAQPPPAESAPPEEIFIWGIPLLGDEKSDTLLLKFLRAREFKVKETLDMIKKTVWWRKEYKTDNLLGEDLSWREFEKAVFMHGHDRQGHPVCYNVFGDKELVQKAFSGAERDHFLRYRIQFLEKGIRQLDFSPDGISTIVQVTDLKRSPGLLNKEVQITKKALSVLLDNYPELVAKQIVINVPWWYLAYTRVFSTVFTPRTKSKIVYVGPSRSTDALFKYIAPEQVPVQYGGLSKEDDSEFSTADAAADLFIKPTSLQTVEIPVSEVGTVVWELRVLGWEVIYGAEFVPDAEDGYTVIVSKTRKLAAADEPVIRNSFKVGEPGKVVLKIDNATSKKKKLLYRFKTKVADSN